MDINIMVAALGLPTIIAFVGTIWYYNKKHKEEFPKIVQENQSVKMELIDIKNKVNNCEKDLIKLETKLDEASKKEQKDIEDLKKKNEITEKAVFDLTIMVSKLEGVPMVLDRIYNKLSS